MTSTNLKFNNQTIHKNRKPLCKKILENLLPYGRPVGGGDLGILGILHNKIINRKKALLSLLQGIYLVQSRLYPSSSCQVALNGPRGRKSTNINIRNKARLDKECGAAEGVLFNKRGVGVIRGDPK